MNDFLRIADKILNRTHQVGFQFNGIKRNIRFRHFITSHTFHVGFTMFKRFMQGGHIKSVSS